MDLEFELYEGKKYSDLIKDIVKNHKSKQLQTHSNCWEFSFNDFG